MDGSSLIIMNFLGTVWKDGGRWFLWWFGSVRIVRGIVDIPIQLAKPAIMQAAHTHCTACTHTMHFTCTHTPHSLHAHMHAHTHTLSLHFLPHTLTHMHSPHTTPHTCTLPCHTLHMHSLFGSVGWVWLVWLRLHLPCTCHLSLFPYYYLLSHP